MSSSRPQIPSKLASVGEGVKPVAPIPAQDQHGGTRVSSWQASLRGRPDPRVPFPHGLGFLALLQLAEPHEPTRSCTLWTSSIFCGKN